MNETKDICITIKEKHSVFLGVISYHLITLSEAEIGILKRYIGTATLSKGPLHNQWVNTPAHDSLLAKGILANSPKCTATNTIFETTLWGKQAIERLVRKKLMTVFICPQCGTFNGTERETADPGIFECGGCGNKFNKDINTAGASQ